jgi:hypothetical protein
MSAGVNVVLAKLDQIFFTLKIDSKDRPSEKTLRRLAGRSLRDFADHVVAEVVGSKPEAVRRGLARHRAKWVASESPETLNRLPWANRIRRRPVK